MKSSLHSFYGKVEMNVFSASGTTLISSTFSLMENLINMQRNDLESLNL